MLVSIWWVLAAFVIGGYAGAVLVAIMSMAHGTSDEEPAVRPLLRARADIARRRHRTPVLNH